MVEVNSIEITSPMGMAKLHTFVTHDKTEHVLNADQFQLYLNENKVKPENVFGKFKEPGWYFMHKIGEKTLVGMVPDYKRDVASVMGLVALCIVDRDWLFSISLDKSSPVVVDVVYYEGKTPRRTMGNSIGDAILGSIYMGLSLELYSKEEKTRGEPWLQ